MKELTIEEKAKRYDEALNRARVLNNGEHIDIKEGYTICEYIFPELKESKDEMIRKELIDFIRREGQHIDKYKWPQWIAWLKKQGKHKSVGSEYDERIRKGVISNLKYLLGKAQGFVKDELEERIAWLESL